MLCLWVEQKSPLRFMLTIEELQKYLDDNNITFEEWMRANMITDEDRKYFDKIWVDAIYKNLGKDT
jgi:hypothetical protein